MQDLWDTSYLYLDPSTTSLGMRILLGFALYCAGAPFWVWVASVLKPRT